MSRKYKILLFVLLVGLFAYLAPGLLGIREVQTKIVRQASEALNAEVAINQVRWRWGPLPHLTIINTTVNHQDYALQLPKTRIYPNWRALVTGKVEIGRIIFLSPHIILNSSFFTMEEAAGETAFPLSLADISVNNGTLDIPAFSREPFCVRKNSFAGIDMEIERSSNQLSVSLASSSSFADKIRVNGSFFTDTSSYSGTCKVEKFQLANLGELTTSVVKPLASRVDFNCDVIGRGLEAVQILFNGDIPAFSLQRLEKPVPFQFGKAKLLLEKNGGDLSAKIFELNLPEPQVSFAGTVSRYLRPDSPIPFYRLDLSARDIDLSGVRSRLLILLGDEHITTTVCNVVRGGRAKSATYTFDAPVAGFADLRSMVINVDVDNADIHVPEVNLDLTQASGPIIIKDGSIHGYNLTASLGPHNGSKGSFSLGLSEDNWLFKLDLDIDADLTALPHTLHYLIHDEHFRSEVLKFSSGGRKKGHLTIGDDLRNFIVDVSIPDLQGAQVSYERISKPIELQGGMLHIQGDRVEWQGVSAGIGPHKLLECSGNLSWSDSNVPFTMKSLAAHLDAATFLAELNRYPVIGAALSPDLSSIAGNISITGGSAGGPFLHPSLWQYRLSAELKDITFTSPHLPETVTLGQGLLEMTENRVNLADGRAEFIGSPLQLSMRLSHHLFSSWQGRLEIDGEVTPEHGKWLAEKDWIPELFFPKIPCLIKKLQINFAENDVSVLGTVQNGAFTDTPVDMVLDVSVKKGLHERTSLHFFKDEQDGLVTIVGDARGSTPQISFQGAINRQTVAAVFNTRLLLNGELEGFFTLVPPAENRLFVFNGRAGVHDLQWLWGNYLRQISISRLSLSGAGERLSIHDLAFSFENEQVTSAGELKFSPWSVTTDLSLHSRSLSQTTLTRFINDLSVFLNKISGSDDKNLASSISGSIAGAIRVRADEFLFAETIKEGKTQSYRLTPLQGRIDFSDRQSTTLFLTDSNFCGLDIDGALRWKDERSNKEFILKNPRENLPLFEDFLPCAGVKNTLIAGPFSVQATLLDENGRLSSGDFRLRAQNGVLQKMDILSKIFKLINFTDLYQGLFSTGFRYKTMKIDGHVTDNHLILDRAALEGEGMDILAQGDINLYTLETDLTFFIVPFKTIDKIINMMPLVGRVIGGKKRHIVTYPVKVTGNLREPELSVLSPAAIGKAAADFVIDTLSLPLDLLPVPDEKESEGKGEGETKTGKPGKDSVTK